MRWNLAFFCALLCQHGKTDSGVTRRSKYTLDLNQEQFIIAYLEAVLEHHTSEGLFEKRDDFVKMWKESKFDFYSLGAAQKKRMKKEMKRLKVDFESELDYLKNGMDSEQYNERVAKFVGSLVPGRENQKAEGVKRFYSAIQTQEEQGNGGDLQDMNEGDTVNADVEEPENKLLEALKAPPETNDWETHTTKNPSKGCRTNNVVEIGVAFDAVMITTAKEIMKMLFLRFN